MYHIVMVRQRELQLRRADIRLQEVLAEPVAVGSLDGDLAALSFVGQAVEGGVGLALVVVEEDGAVDDAELAGANDLLDLEIDGN